MRHEITKLTKGIWSARDFRLSKRNEYYGGLKLVTLQYFDGF